MLHCCVATCKAASYVVSYIYLHLYSAVNQWSTITAMEDSSQGTILPQQEVENGPLKRSEMCIGWNNVMMMPPNCIVTGMTIIASIET